MKNLSKRTKMLLAIGGIVIVVVVAGLLLLGPGDEVLFGATVIHISPENPRIVPGQNLNLTINSVGNCFWTTSNANAVKFNLGSGPMNEGSTGVADGETKSVWVKGYSLGQSVISAKCALFTRSTTVYVVAPTPTPTPTPSRTPTPPPTATPTRTLVPTATPTGMWLSPSNATVNRGGTIAYRIANTGGAATVCGGYSSDKGTLVGSATGATFTAGQTAGTGYVKMYCNNVWLQTGVTVQ